LASGALSRSTVVGASAFPTPGEALTKLEGRERSKDSEVQNVATMRRQREKERRASGAKRKKDGRASGGEVGEEGGGIGDGELLAMMMPQVDTVLKVVKAGWKVVDGQDCGTADDERVAALRKLATSLVAETDAMRDHLLAVCHPFDAPLVAAVMAYASSLLVRLDQHLSPSLSTDAPSLQHSVVKEEGVAVG